jgi:hypothetical protein
MVEHVRTNFQDSIKGINTLMLFEIDVKCLQISAVTRVSLFLYDRSDCVLLSRVFY